MAVLHDYKCEKHGYFESLSAECPMKDCKAEVFKVFLKAPSLKSERTKKTDSTLKGLAQDFGMTNLKSTREGEHQEGYLSRNNSMSAKELAAEKEKADFLANQNQPQREARPGDAAIWGGGMNGLSMQSILAGNAVKSIHGEAVGINPKEAGNLTGPKAASYIADHDNLQVKSE